MAYTPVDLTGEVALLTAGSGGIGFGMADAVAAAGAEVSITLLGGMVEEITGVRPE